MNKTIDIIKQIQEEYDRRSVIEAEAAKLICKGKMLEAIELLNTLDDNKVKELLK